ncbi:hypothetical protein AALO_G00239880 [Alosa alosa]|uniref:Uncharacterized protein n=1 Tax=Alosa alosa TaxID=278164 RepID=A0AAV6FWJ1_9TELE|nr:hypothetical protein AALO_G00239880 [Alosa alosa]
MLAAYWHLANIESLTVYAQMNRAVPILRLFFDEEKETRPDFRLNRASITGLLVLLQQERHHGWGPVIEVLVFLFWLASGSYYRIVSRAFDMPKSTCLWGYRGSDATGYQGAIHCKRSYRKYLTALLGWLSMWCSVRPWEPSMAAISVSRPQENLMHSATETASYSHPISCRQFVIMPVASLMFLLVSQVLSMTPGS